MKSIEIMKIISKFDTNGSVSDKIYIQNTQAFRKGNMMVTYSLMDNDITGEKFKSFVSYCLKNSTHFSVTFHDYEEIAQLFLKSELKISNFERFAKWRKVVLDPRDYEYLPAFRLKDEK